MLELRWGPNCETNWGRFTQTVSGGRYSVWVQRQNPDLTVPGYEVTAQAAVNYYSDQAWAPNRPSRACVKKWLGSAWGPDVCTAWIT
ncbi:UNVERIFIED_ORG: hypothetical protein FHR35_005404 [Microbispora rosea subsp. rosea]